MAHNVLVVYRSGEELGNPDEGERHKEIGVSKCSIVCLDQLTVPLSVHY
jgi:hypothetical protein